MCNEIPAHFALLHHCDNWPIASMAGRVVAAELRRIEPRCLASVEKEGIPAAEAVAEKPGKFVEVDPSFGDDEMDLGGARNADPVPRLAIVRVDDEGRMKGAVDDEHRSRPRGEIRLRIVGEKSTLVHTAVHAKSQRLAFGFEVGGECGKGTVRLTVVTSPVDAQVVFSQIEATNDVGRALEGLAAARLGLGYSGRRETKLKAESGETSLADDRVRGDEFGVVGDQR